MKKVLILGIGDAQADALERIAHMGDIETHALSYSPEGPGRKYAGHFSVVDIKDIDGVYAYALENKIDVVYSTGSDLAMPTACKVSERLGLPRFVSSNAAFLCQNKQHLRHLLGDMKGNVRFKEIADLSELKDWDVFPCIMKPVDSQGQRGVARVDSPGGFEEQFEKSMVHSASKRLIVEEFVEGREISVNCYMVDGELAFYLPSDRHVFNEFPGGIIKEHHLPCTFDEGVEDEVRELVWRTLGLIGIDNGPAYFQIMIGNNGPKLIEVTPRLDGCHMWRLIEHYCGVNLMDATLEHLINGKKPSFEPMPEGSRMLRFLTKPPGQAYDRSEYDVEGADFLYWYYENGETVRKLNGFMEKGGYTIERTGANS